MLLACVPPASAPYLIHLDRLCNIAWLELFTLSVSDTGVRLLVYYHEPLVSHRERLFFSSHFCILRLDTTFATAPGSPGRSCRIISHKGTSTPSLVGALAR